MNNTHFGRYRGLKNMMRHPLKPSYMERMIVRKSVDKLKNLHPSAKARWNQMT